MSDSSNKFKNYSIATLCIVACIFLISILYLLNNGIKQYKEQLVLQSQVQEEIIQQISTVYEDYKLYIDTQIAAQQEIIDKANNSSVILSEITSIVGTRFLENERIIDKGEADKLVNDSILIIEKISPRFGDLVSIINRKYINER
tara:strand:+ start:508 stop:942 length:435 start_codon:yes stop_codon:yes gene_type:complete